MVRTKSRRTIPSILKRLYQPNLQEFSRRRASVCSSSLFTSSALVIYQTRRFKMAKTGLAKGTNKGHVTEEIPRKAKPSNRKGVSL